MFKYWFSFEVAADLDVRHHLFFTPYHSAFITPTFRSAAWTFSARFVGLPLRCCIVVFKNNFSIGGRQFDEGCRSLLSENRNGDISQRRRQFK